MAFIVRKILANQRNTKVVFTSSSKTFHHHFIKKISYLFPQTGLQFKPANKRSSKQATLTPTIRKANLHAVPESNLALLQVEERPPQRHRSVHERHGALVVVCNIACGKQGTITHSSIVAIDRTYYHLVIKMVAAINLLLNDQQRHNDMTNDKSFE